MTKQEEKAIPIVNKETLIATDMALLLLLCLAGALWTAYWSLRFGLAPRPPLSVFQTIVRFLIVTLALVPWLVRGDLTERSALACTVVAAGSSGLYGLGLNSTALQVVRLLFHFLAYSLGVVAIVRWFRAKRAHSHMSVTVARHNVVRSQVERGSMANPALEAVLAGSNEDSESVGAVSEHHNSEERMRSASFPAMEALILLRATASKSSSSRTRPWNSMRKP